MPSLAVIFDVDGVLVDSYQAHFQSWRQLFRELGTDCSEQEFAASFGRTSREILRDKLGGELSDDRLRELDDRKEHLYRQAFRENFRPMDGAAELVSALAKDGFALGIGSSGPAANVALALELLRLRPHFAAIVTGADVKRGKPDPQVFQLAAERLGVAPAACAVVEDAAHGITAANRAGMASIGLVGTVTRDRLAHAKLIIDGLRELTPERVRALISSTGP
ncbi:MAG: HAD family phosphatase [Pirellulales bacterium]